MGREPLDPRSAFQPQIHRDQQQVLPAREAAQPAGWPCNLRYVLGRNSCRIGVFEAIHVGKLLQVRRRSEVSSDEKTPALHQWFLAGRDLVVYADKVSVIPQRAIVTFSSGVP